VLRNSLAYVATLATTADIIAGWHKPSTA
jgi:hypothetical protein